MINELKNDKQKLEENILELLKEFNKKYPEIIIYEKIKKEKENE
jgi:hypothetical protein